MREFLRQTNGGTFRGRWVMGCDEIHALDDPSLPRGLVVFPTDAGGDPLVLDLRTMAPDQGSCTACEMSHATGEMVPVAASFRAWLQGVWASEEDACT